MELFLKVFLLGLVLIWLLASILSILNPKIIILGKEINVTRVQLGIINLVVAILLGIIATPLNTYLCNVVQPVVKRDFNALILDSMDNPQVDLYLEVNGYTSRQPSDMEGRVTVPIGAKDGNCLLCHCSNILSLEYQIKDIDGLLLYKDIYMLPIDDFRDLDKFPTFKTIVIK